MENDKKYNPAALVEVLGILPEHVSDDKILDAFESGVWKSVSLFARSDVERSDIAFNFPLDPSVDSSDIPLVIKINIPRNYSRIMFDEKMRTDIGDVARDIFGRNKVTVWFADLY